ncbi:pyrroloquinoline quinone biosynthesis peptide chaperone PqqD [Acidisoma sp. 7E03]
MQPTAETVPSFPRGVRYRFDAARNSWVLLTPERALIPDGPAQAVLAEIDGSRSIAIIVATLAARFTAPAKVIEQDVVEMVAELMQQGVLIVRGAAA